MGVLEGISFEIKHNLNLLALAGGEINEIRAIGGGAKSEKWLQLKADIFGKNVKESGKKKERRKKKLGSKKSTKKGKTKKKKKKKKGGGKKKKKKKKKKK